MQKDAERRIALAEAMGQGNAASTEDATLIEAEAAPITYDGWCCMYRVLALQEDFQTEKPFVQSIIEMARHVSLFLPRFHCELNAIEMLWGYAKYRACICFFKLGAAARSTVIYPGYQNYADGKCATVP